jgi:hypothetical protein
MASPLTALLGALALAAAPAPPAPAGEPAHLFDIATVAGATASTWAPLAYDRAHDELFAVFGGQVHVFNAAGMETFTFGGDGDLGVVERLAPLENGDLLVLAGDGRRRSILRCDYRGERIGTFEPRGLPAAFAGFDPDRLQVQGGLVHLVEAAAMRVVVTDLSGLVERTLDLAALVRARDPAIKLGLSGFWVDDQGGYLFTMPLAFTAFTRSAGGELRRFGARGSAPGKFNVAGAIATDERGAIFVLDRLRSVVLVFDRSLRFVREFGYRGDGPTNLVAPYDLAVGNGKAFVSQARSRGVKVFRYEPVEEPATPDADPAGAPRE